MIGAGVCVVGVTLLFSSVASMMTGCMLGESCETGPIPSAFVLPSLAFAIFLMALGSILGVAAWAAGSRKRP